LLSALCAAFLGVAAWRYAAIPAPVRPYDGKTEELTLVATGFSGSSPYGEQADVLLNGVPGVFYYSGEETVKPGDRLTGTFRVALTPRSGSHFKATTYGEFSITEGPLRLLDRPVLWARAVKDRISSLFSGDNASLLTGILTGDRTGFSDPLSQDLFSAGLTHVAAVSGLHVSMLAGFIALLLRSRRRSFVVALPLVLLYVAVTGFTPSAVRAGIMITVYLAAPLFGREYVPLRALALAFLLVLIADPYALFEPGLQLSFSSTLGLLLFAAQWQGKLTGLIGKLKLPKTVVKVLASSLSSSLSALVFSVPFAAYWFGGVSLISPVSNLLLLGFVNLIFLGGALSLFLPFLAPAAGAVLEIFRGGLRILGGIPYAMLYTEQPYMLAWLCYGYALFLIALFTRRWRASASLAAASLALCLVLTVWDDPGLEVAALDVGQGQCVIVRSNGFTAVLDCGGSPSAGREAARFLQSRGERTVDLLLLSHYDADHMSGAASLRALTDVRRILGPALDGIPEQVEGIAEDTVLTLGGASLTLIPSRWFGDDNASCLTVLLESGGFTFLSTGDLSAPAERWLTRYAALPPVDVMMVGHHGSSGSTSEELLDAVKPKAAVISVGQNRYGHPSPEVLGRLYDRQIAVYRTDLGTVTLRTEE
jgi:competence protein ComEC